MCWPPRSAPWIDSSMALLRCSSSDRRTVSFAPDSSATVWTSSPSQKVNPAASARMRPRASPRAPNSRWVVMVGQWPGLSCLARCSRRISQRRHWRSITCWMLLALGSMSTPSGGADGGESSSSPNTAQVLRSERIRRGRGNRGIPFSGCVLSRSPARGSDSALGHSLRVVLQVGCHGVVPAVQISEEGDRRHDLDDLPVVEVLPQLVEVGRRCLVRDRRRLPGEPQRRALLFTEERARLELPDAANFLVLGAVDAREIGHVRLTITAARGLTGDEAHEHLQLFLNRALVEDRPVQLHEGLGDGGAARHREDAVGKEPARRRIVLETLAELRNFIARKRLYVSHRFPTSRRPRSLDKTRTIQSSGIVARGYVPPSRV